MLSAVIAAPRPGITIEAAAADIERSTGLRAYVNGPYGSSPRDFNASTVDVVCKNTGIPISFGITVIVGFIVGVAISLSDLLLLCAGEHEAPGGSEGHGRKHLHLMSNAHRPGIDRRPHWLWHRAGGYLWLCFWSPENKQPPFYMPDIIPQLSWE